jgi:hypothetical protein
MSKGNVFYSVVFILVAAMGMHSHGAVINVTTTDDNVAGSLRAAITTANTNGEADTIKLPPGTYVLTGTPGDDANLSGDLDINSGHTITIIGSSPGNTIIDAGGVDRVFHILNGTLSIYRVTIQNGSPEKEEHGGGIYNNGTLTLTKCIIQNNSAGDGFRWNGFNAGNGGHGGGIYNQGTIALTDCTIRNNHTGEGMWSKFDRAGNGGHGGGIYNMGLAGLTRCTTSNNHAGNGGETSSAGYPGGDGGSGGGIYNGSTISLTNCTLYKNNTGYGNYSDGGGFGVGGNGGGLCNTAGAVTTLKHCTITANSTIVMQGSYLITGNGGGVYNDPAGTINTENTIISDNIVELGGNGPDCYGTLNSLGYNLVRDDSHCTIIGNTTGNITGLDPKLGVLANNGGPTLTCALNQDSPAIDAGYSSGINRDQRNFTRPQDIPAVPNVSDGADIGAFELKALYTISGTVTFNGNPLADVTLAFGDSGVTTTTDENGNYSYTVPYGWSGIVTPSKENYAFTPASREYSNVTVNKSGQDYTANAYTVSIAILSPADGDTVSGTVVISVSASSSTGRSSTQSVHGVEFYIDNIHVATDTTEPYQYTWDTTLYANGAHTIKVSASNGSGMTQEAEITVMVANVTYMSLSRNRLNFGADTAWTKTGDQSFLIDSSSGVPLNWTITDDAEWLECTPGSGTGPGLVTVSIDPSQMAVGTYTATVTATAGNAVNSPQAVNVYLTVYRAGTTTPPFGTFGTPINNSTVRSSIPVTGWVVDDIDIESIYIYREPLATEGNNLIYIGTAVTVEGARPDVELAYPDYPMNYKAGWGYMMLTNFLPDGGNGTFKIHAIAADAEGHQITLGTKTITCDNDNAVKPFGAIDTPEQGGIASGSKFINWGWALTPQPNKIPVDGSTISVWIDGIKAGQPVYNIYRSDIANLFPGYANSDGAVGYFIFDTSVYKNGVHTIQWSAIDSGGNTDGIGSRYFTILNIGNSQSNAQSQSSGKIVFDQEFFNLSQTVVSPLNNPESIKVKKGLKDDIASESITSDGTGVFRIKIEELERLVIDFSKKSATIKGFTIVGNHFRPLPIGSIIHSKEKKFYWQPGPGFVGYYRFVFIERSEDNQIRMRNIHVKIEPKSAN